MKDKFRHYIHRVIIGIDQALNALLGGSPVETISARAWRHREQGGWKQACWLINLVLFWDSTERAGRKVTHCEWAYLNVLEDEYMPNGYE